ncbi:SpoIID/LytB domain-containing protein [Candidatus Babeliales bacterium]|nr:SpoIID/LytB domain-containing protein [Candidatus Babeliales bacterium]
MFVKKTQHKYIINYKYIINIFIFFIFFTNLALSNDINNSKQNKLNTNNLKIKVLLEEKKISQNKIKYDISTKNGFYIEDLNNSKKIIFKKNILEIVVKDNNIYLPYFHENKKVFKKINSKKIKLIPISGKFSINKKTYQGDLVLNINPEKNTLYIISNIGLNDYLYSVLQSESIPTWPPEMQKVQAIVSRTYAIHTMLELKKNKKNPKPYDIKNNNSNQVYNGDHYYTFLRKSITDTQDLVLTYNGKIALAMFDACCGGIIPADTKSLNFSKAPYLARRSACNYCKNYKLYKWHKDFSVDTMMSCFKNYPKLSKNFNNPKKLGRLLDIKITEKDKAGLVKKIKLIFSKKNIIITGKDLWFSIKDKIHSQTFNIKKEKNRIIIEGKGHGHHIGLCQWGARKLVDQNWRFREILKFYYPKTQLSILKISKLEDAKI